MNLLRKVVDLIYKIYYRVLYWPLAIWVIYHPKLTILPENVSVCHYFHGDSTTTGRHQHFITVFPCETENKWLFFKRHFAFQIKDQGWYVMPSLTPWGMKHGYQEYGLNTMFIRRHMEGINISDIEIVTWK